MGSTKVVMDVKCCRCGKLFKKKLSTYHPHYTKNRKLSCRKCKMGDMHLMNIKNYKEIANNVIERMKITGELK